MRRTTKAGSTHAHVLWLLVAVSGLCSAVPSSQAAVGTEDLLAQARAAAHRDAHDLALRTYEELLVGQPGLRDSLAPEIATQLTWSGRYDEALVEFRRMLERHPQRIDLWLIRALAEAWSGRTDEALQSYRRVLTTNPENRDAQLGEARMLSWLGRLNESLRSYRARLSRDPQDGEAWLGLAQVLAWRGDNLQARAICQALIEEQPIARARWAAPAGTGNSGALGVSGESTRVPRERIPGGTWEVLALACRWSGRDDLAVVALDAAERADRGTPATRRLAQDLRALWVPRLTTTLDLSLDSDHFSTRALRLEGDIPIRHRGHLRWGAFANRYDRPASLPQNDRWLFAAAEGRVSESWYGSTQLRAQIDRPPGAEYLPAEAALNAIWTARDRLRVDLGASRSTIFTYEVLPERIVAEQFGAGLTWRLPLPPSLVCAGDYTTYSDNNERIQARAGLRWLVRPRRPRLELETRTLFQDARRWTGHGYWCPDRNQAHSVRLGAEIPVVLGIGLNGTIENGVGREARNDWSLFTAYQVGITGQHGRLRIEGRFGHAGPSERVRQGYRRNAGSIAISLAL